MWQFIFYSSLVLSVVFVSSSPFSSFISSLPYISSLTSLTISEGMDCDWGVFQGMRPTSEDHPLTRYRTTRRDSDRRCQTPAWS